MEHAKASQAMHAVLHRTPQGREISKFVGRTFACRHRSRQDTSLTNVFNISKILLTVLNQEDGPERLGFQNEHRHLPKFMCVLDLFGERVAAWSNDVTLLRELCACNYGASNSNSFDNGSKIRHEVDAMAAATNESATPTSLCLVLTAQWGESVSSRFWRLMTIRQLESGRFVDSEYALTSMQSPPAKQCNSVLSQCVSPVPQTVVDAFYHSWYARCLETDGTGSDASPSEDENCADKRRIAVLNSLLLELKKENAWQRATLELMNSQKGNVINENMEKRFEMEKSMLYNEIGNLTTYNDDQVRRTKMEEAKVTLLSDEISAADVTLKKLYCAVVDLRGEALVADELHIAEIAKLKETIKDLRNEVKRATAARCQDVEIRRTSKLKINELEGLLDAQNADMESLKKEIHDSRYRCGHSRDAAADQLSKLVDLTSHQATKINSLEAVLMSNAGAKPIVLLGVARAITHAVGTQRGVFRFISKLRSIVKQRRMERAREHRETAETSHVCDDTVTVELDDKKHIVEAPPPAPITPSPFPADAVASAKACIASLTKYIDLTTTVTHSPIYNNSVQFAQTDHTYIVQRQHHIYAPHGNAHHHHHQQHNPYMVNPYAHQTDPRQHRRHEPHFYQQ